MAGFAEHDRGKLIMACGTGKTFTALRIAEAVAGVGGRVLYLVPSISLFQQSMREWAEQRAVPHRYVGICSDTRAGRTDEAATLTELEIPVTTDPSVVSGALRNAPADAMTAVFCTYHSLALVEQAQDEGAPRFELVLCDEAHRTTGIERPGDKSSPFVLVHDAQRIRAAKRLYMTATPRLYTEGAKAKASSHSVEVFSMDDPATYGPELHRLPFSRAVEQDLLSDYKVVVLAMSEQHVDGALQAHLASGAGEINLTDAAKIVGCWRALQNPENSHPGQRADPFPEPRYRLYQHHRVLQAARSALVRDHCAGRRSAAGNRTAGRPPLRDPSCRRTAPRARPKGPDRVAEGRIRGTLPHPLECALPVRGHRRASARRGAVHEPAQQPRRYRSSGRPRHAQGAEQGIWLHHPAHRRAGRRRSCRGARRQRTLRRRLGRAARVAFAR